MTQEEKQLLLKDLCARLPYGVKCHFKYGSAEDDVTLSCIDNNVARFEYGWYGKFHVIIDPQYIKPYLRPMDSMTDEEYREFGYDVLRYTPREFDWLNANHFDYRGLIPMGLAIEAPEGMYKTKPE